MRAVVAETAGSPDVLVATEKTVPEPAPGQVRLRVAYCGMNPIDAFVRAGTFAFPGFTFPAVLGLEHTGRIDAVGEGVDQDLVGRRVISQASFGGYADYSLARADALIGVPDDMPWPLATAFRGCTYTAWHCLTHVARANVGTAVFHSAAGPIGIMMTQIAKERGWQVIGLAGGQRKLDYARPYGADHLIDYLDDSWVDQVLQLTDGQGVDLVVDGNQGPNGALNYRLLARLGQLIYMGASAGAPAPDVPVSELIMRSISVSGFSLADIECARGGEEDRSLVEAVRSGRWKVPIGKIVDLDQVGELHRQLESRALMGRALIRVGGDEV